MNYSKGQHNTLNIIKKRKIKILLKEPKNKECFECSNLYPEYISLNNGIFICKNCVKNHLKFPKSISDIYFNDLNILSLKEIQYLSCGGNRKLIEFVNSEYPNLVEFSPIYFYQTYAMNYYRKYLEYLIEGGKKPTKPDKDKAYELMSHKHFDKNTNLVNENIFINKKYKTENNSIINDNYIKINRNNALYPKIKPIVGRKNDCAFTRSLSTNNKLSLQDLNLTSSNYTILKHLNKSLNEEKFNSSSTDFNYRYNSNFNSNYDTDGNYNDLNDLNYINENEINEQINNLSNFNELAELSININNSENLKIKNKIIRRNREDANIKVFKINNTITNNTISKRIYSKPNKYNCLKTFQENYNLNNSKKCFNNENELNSKKIRNINESTNILSIEDLRNYLNNNKKIEKEKCIFNLKQNFNKPILIEDLNSKTEDIGEKNQKRNYNNINNNIIINRNFNVFYNNHNLHKIFKKKPIGNSFSINDRNDRKYQNDKSNFYIEKGNNNNFFMTSTDEKNLFKIKRKIKMKNEYKKKFCNKIIEKNNENTFIKVNIKNSKLKSNNSFGNLKLNQFNKIEVEKNEPFIIKNNNQNNEEINLKSKLFQKENKIKNLKRQKIESFEKIKVNQKNKRTNMKEKIRNINNNKLDYIGVNTIEKKEKERNKSKSENRIKTSKSYSNILDTQKRKLVLMKELINLPSGKRKTILEIIKTNNMANKSVSPSAKRILGIFNEPKML